MMKPYTKDILCTVAVKSVLLFLLWHFCVKDMHPNLSNSREWLFGKTEQQVLTP